MHPTAHITAGSAGIGAIGVNPADVRGEGGHLEPTIVVPVSARLNARPGDQQLALIALEAQLGVGASPGATRVGLSARLDLRPGMRVASVPWGAPDTGLDLRFRVTSALIEMVERVRHAGDGVLQLSIEFEAVVAWVRANNEMAPGMAGDPAIPFEPLYGMLADLTTFWTTRIDTLVFTVEQTTWLERVLPQLGYDEVRLVEIRLPRDLDDAHARAAFGRQLRHFDRSGYEECVSASRALLHAWERQLGATSKSPVSTVVGDAVGWTPSDPRRTFLDQLWVAAKGLANAAHHEADQPAPLSLGRPETRAHLLLTAALSEWLTMVLGQG